MGMGMLAAGAAGPHGQIAAIGADFVAATVTQQGIQALEAYLEARQAILGEQIGQTATSLHKFQEIVDRTVATLKSKTHQMGEDVTSGMLGSPSGAMISTTLQSTAGIPAPVADVIGGKVAEAVIGKIMAARAKFAENSARAHSRSTQLSPDLQEPHDDSLAALPGFSTLATIASSDGAREAVKGAATMGMGMLAAGVAGPHGQIAAIGADFVAATVTQQAITTLEAYLEARQAILGDQISQAASSLQKFQEIVDRTVATLKSKTHQMGEDVTSGMLGSPSGAMISTTLQSTAGIPAPVADVIGGKVAEAVIGKIMAARAKFAENSARAHSSNEDDDSLAAIPRIEDIPASDNAAIEQYLKRLVVAAQDSQASNYKPEPIADPWDGPATLQSPNEWLRQQYPEPIPKPEGDYEDYWDDPQPERLPVPPPPRLTDDGYRPPSRRRREVPMPSNAQPPAPPSPGDPAAWWWERRLGDPSLRTVRAPDPSWQTTEYRERRPQAQLNVARGLPLESSI